ncbi:MAG: YggU family protein [Gemmatimonadota bacterium]|nr:MAG: YggU family protein [Gemmatimonadota bacterium]
MKEKSVVLQVRVQPRASVNRIEGILEDGTLKVKVTAPPERGKANRSVVRLLAHHFDVKPSQIEIVSGHTSGRKTVRILGLDANIGKRDF